VGIVGAGPAGMAAADRLREQGYQVTVYDRHDRPGGLLTYGIPASSWRSASSSVASTAIDGGVEFVTNCDVGTDATLAQLRERHDAVLLAMGV